MKNYISGAIETLSDGDCAKRTIFEDLTIEKLFMGSHISGAIEILSDGDCAKRTIFKDLTIAEALQHELKRDDKQTA